MINSISAFFPAYNDAETIAGLVRRASEILAGWTPDFEVIVVNDGSVDSTAEKLDELQKEFPGLRVVTHKTNRGYGGALRSGFAAASKELVFYTDGDGQYDVRELENLLLKLSDGVDVVNGYKKNRADGVHRKILGSVYATSAKFFFRLPVSDVDCDFRLIRASRLHEIDLQMDSGAICVELVKKLSRAGSVFTEVGVGHYPRVAGRSQFLRFGRILQTLTDLTRLWFQLCIFTNRAKQRKVSIPETQFSNDR